MNDIKQKLDSLSPEQRTLLLQRIKAKKVEAESQRSRPAVSELLKKKGMNFSLIFFSGNGETASSNKYQLVLECAKFADENNFSGIFTPERHFQAVGGLFPNPSVLSAALAMITKRIQIRAGSVVLPLHNPVRIAEEWSVVDNLSNGRVAIGAATGWHPADFILNPTGYEDRKKLMHENLDIVRRMWRGELVKRQDISGNEVEVSILPKPIQKELPIFLTTAGNPDTWRRAGEMGLNVLCSLANHPPETLIELIGIYREARSKVNLDPDKGTVSVMLHTRVGNSDIEVKEMVREPLRGFFTNFIKQNDTLNPYSDGDEEIRKAIDNESDRIIAYAFERYFNQTSLMGSPLKCLKMVEKLCEYGVTEIACLMDFGLEPQLVLEGLKPLSELKAWCQVEEQAPTPSVAEELFTENV